MSVPPEKFESHSFLFGRPYYQHSHGHEQLGVCVGHADGRLGGPLCLGCGVGDQGCVPGAVASSSKFYPIFRNFGHAELADRSLRCSLV